MFTFTLFCFSLARLFVTLTYRLKVLTLENIQINLIFCSLIRTFVIVPRRLRPLWTWVGGGQDIYKGVYYALVLTS